MHIGILESNPTGSGFEGIRLAKERGAHTTFFTRDLRRYLDVPGARPYFEHYVDEVVHCETNEPAALFDRVRAAAARARFDAFLTMSEYDVVLAAQVARRLELPGADPGAVAAARDKVLMRETCARRGVPMPAFRAVATVQEALSAARDLGLPCVVKPADETGGVDVRRCSTPDAVAEHFLAVSAKERNTRGQKRRPRVLVEECLHGYEVSVEVLVEGDRHQVLGVTDKSVAVGAPAGCGAFVEIGHVFPSLLPARTTGACAEVAVGALRAVGLDLGLAHVEIKVCPDGPKLIEVNARPAGDRITKLLDAALGISTLDLVLDQYLGASAVDGLDARPVRGAAIRFLAAPPGTVAAVGGVEAACAMPGIREAVVAACRGTRVGPLRHNRDRLGHVLAVADDAYTASRMADAAAHEIDIRVLPDAPVRPGRGAGRVAAGIEDLIGHTPLVRLSVGDAPTGARILAKLERANPLSSVKDRAALFMLRAAEESGKLVRGRGTIVEATSGNTGISLAALAAARGYRCVVVLPDSATAERIGLLRALGADVVLTPAAEGYPGAIAKAEEIRAATADSWFPKQHENPDNVRAHYETTGPEIWADTGGDVDVLVCGVGTGGTLTGVARYLKERSPRIHVVAVEPERSPVLSQGIGGPHRIPGLNGGFVAPTTDLGCIDEVMTVSDADALDTARLLARRRGLLVGLSSGAAAHACLRLARKPEYDGRTIVTILPDTGERYLSVWDGERP